MVPYLSVLLTQLFGFTLLGGISCYGTFPSSLTESQVGQELFLHVFLFTALMEGLQVYPTDNKTAYLVFSAIVLLICLLLYRMMHNFTIAIAAGAVGVGGLTAIYLIKPTILDGSVIKVFEWLSVVSRFESFSIGILDLSGVIYYLSIIFLFAFLTMQVIKKRRWS